MTNNIPTAQPCEKFFFNNQFFGCPEGVYFPAEDSFLLAESVEVLRGCSALDMGCGSGIQTLNLLFKGAGKVLAVDANPKAIKATNANTRAAGFGEKARAIKSDLFRNMNDKFDLIVFNPPYVETKKPQGKGTNRGGQKKFVDLDGGPKGREVLDRFLKEMPRRLAKGGTCYFLQTSINGYAETGNKLKKMKIKCEIIARKRGFFEELAVFRARKI